MSIALRVNNVTKTFRVPLDRSSTLKYRLTHLRSSGRYRVLRALDGVGFEVPMGQFLGIVGPNGCGKSTLLKILSRIYAPTSGSVEINGRISPFLELGVGFNPELTARENIFLNGAVLGLTRRQLTARVEGILDFAGLEEFADQKIKNYSSGMQVKLAFSVAIQADAPILLMDEVLAVGDAEFQDKCFDVFAEYRREGRTVVLVTHDLGAVDNHCDRAILLDHGRLLADGSAAEVTTRYRRMVGQRIESQRIDHQQGPEVDEAAGASSNRWGSNEVRIREVALLDAAGAPHQSFTTDAAMQIRVRYEVIQRVEELTVGLALHRADGTLLAGNNTYISGVRIPCPPPGGKGEVTYVIPEVPLLAGTYRLTVALHARYASHPYDHMDQAFEFKVVDESCRVGLVELGGHWEVDGARQLRRIMSRAEALAAEREVAPHAVVGGDHPNNNPPQPASRQRNPEGAGEP